MKCPHDFIKINTKKRNEFDGFDPNFANTCDISETRSKSFGVEVETEKDDLMANAKETYEKMVPRNAAPPTGSSSHKTTNGRIFC